MQWNDFWFAIGSMSLAGSAACLLYALFRRLFRKAGAGLRLALLKISVCLYLLPLVYPAMLLGRTAYYSGTWVYKGNLGMGVPELIGTAYRVAGKIWLAGLAVGILLRAVQYVRLRKLMKGSIPVEDGSWLKLYEDCRKKYPARRIRLYQNDLLDTPMVVGVFRPAIILPFRSYPAREMCMMLEHELHHIYHRDLHWRRLMLLASWLHWFNPLVYRLIRWVTLEQEIVCDLAVCGTNPSYTDREYCQFLYDAGTGGRDNVFAAALTESRSNLEKRIEAMAVRKTIKKLGKAAGAVCCMAYVLASVLPAYAVSEGAASLEEKWRREVEVATEIEPPPPMEIQYETDDGTVTEVYAEEEMTTWSSMVMINHAVAPDTRMCYRSQTMQAGEKVVISVICDEPDLAFRIGISNETTGELTYVEGKDALLGTFNIEETGIYRAYVQNCSDQIANLHGNARYPE